MANSASGEAVLERALRLLEAVETLSSPTVAGLVSAAGLPRTTGYRLVSSLRELGLITISSEGEVSVGTRLWELAQQAPISRTLRAAALPFMQDVNSVVQQTTQLSVLTQEGVLIVERLSRHGAVANPAEVADTMPAHLTSMGHVLLAFSDPEVVEAWHQSQPQDPIAERPQLSRELTDVRSRGHSVLKGLINEETAGLSVPILGPRLTTIAALTVVVPRDSPDLLQFLAALQTAARGIGRALRDK
ncbi:IclR family transcriptional regulator [Nesterenkonia haasae]|uniref:IclR family transcriptional regulator n=1 Tax=Nesterenkonia haasae TaxID=2587813 RepID=UPI001391F953|nr:IclR family transcriptional regulator [Nesterenkonia haasae]NDK31980.1 IclR family transcriptional regulator [Nesterenkonia haasae]